MHWPGRPPNKPLQGLKRRRGVLRREPLKFSNHIHPAPTLQLQTVIGHRWKRPPRTDGRFQTPIYERSSEKCCQTARRSGGRPTANSCFVKHSPDRKLQQAERRWLSQRKLEVVEDVRGQREKPLPQCRATPAHVYPGSQSVPLARSLLEA